MRRGMVLIWLGATAVVSAIVGAVSYGVGWASGAAARLPQGAGAEPYYYGPHFFGFGFGFFPFLFLLLVLFLVFRMGRWRGPWSWGGWGYRGYGPPPQPGATPPPSPAGDPWQGWPQQPPQQQPPQQPPAPTRAHDPEKPAE